MNSHPRKAITLEKSGIKIATMTQNNAKPVLSIAIPNLFHPIPGGITIVPSLTLVTLFRRRTTMGTSRPRIVSRVRLSCDRGNSRDVSDGEGQGRRRGKES